MMTVLTMVDHVIMNIVKPISWPTTVTLVVFLGMYESSMSERIMTASSRRAPMLVRSTHDGGSTNMLVPMSSMNTSGHTNKFMKNFGDRLIA